MPLIRFQGEIYFYNVTKFAATQIEFLAAPGATTSVVTIEYIDETNSLVTFVQKDLMTIVGLTGGHVFQLPSTCVAFRVLEILVNPAVTIGVNSSAYGITSDGLATSAPLSAPALAPTRVLFPITKPVEASTTSIPWKAVRATSTGALFSNVTAVMAKEGTVTAARISTEVFSCLYPGNWDSRMDSVYPKDRYFGALENGLYTFTLPDSGAEQYRDTLQGTTRALIAPAWAALEATAGVFDLDKLAYANIIAFNDIGGDATTLAITVDRHIEFRSSSVLSLLDSLLYSLRLIMQHRWLWCRWVFSLKTRLT
jgi:hypothetical protein